MSRDEEVGDLYGRLERLEAENARLRAAIAPSEENEEALPLPAMVPCPLCVERGWPPTCPETGDDCEECFGTGQVVEAAPVRDAGVKEGT